LKNTSNVVINLNNVISTTLRLNINVVYENGKIVSKMNLYSFYSLMITIHSIVTHCLGIKVNGNLNTPSSLDPLRTLLRTKLG